MPHGPVWNHRVAACDGDALLTQETLGRVFRQESGKILAGLVGWSGSFDLAEEGLQDAFEAAARAWPSQGLPQNPGAWLTTVARRKLISRWRRHREIAVNPEVLALAESPREPDPGEGDYPDERLKLLFVCCHPSLPEEQRVALTLHCLGGLTTAEIAAAYLIPVATLAQRLVRAKRKITQEGIRFHVPEPQDLSARIDGVLKVLYLIFTEGYAATLEDRRIREDLCQEAIRLTRHLEQWLRQTRTDLAPGQTAEVLGLLSLMLLHEARRPARWSQEGGIVLLADQNRELWDRSALAEGRALLEGALLSGHPGPYQVQAAILQVHCEAPSAGQTDWVQIMGLYRQLLRWEDTPVVRLNAAVAVAQVAGPQAGLELMAPLKEALGDQGAFFLVRAQWKDQLGDPGAPDDYLRALEFLRNRTERAWVLGRLADPTPSRRPT